MKILNIKIASKFFLLFIASLFLLNGCRPRTVETGQPKPGEIPYPVLLVEDNARRENALGVWKGITQGQGIADAPQPVLHPVTSTLVALPQFANQNLMLPKVGEDVPMREDESREALRRFMKDGGALLCGNTQQQLSLVERTDEPDGTKRAVYQQQLFRYPIRGEFGRMEIVFTGARRIVNITSTCLPNTDGLQRAVADLRPNDKVTPESLVAAIKGQTIAIKNEDGSTQNLTVGNENEINVQELVIYPKATNTNPQVVELYLAFAVKLANRAIAYYDAQTGKLLAATGIKILSSVN